jgi:hypothetical protein
MRPYIRTHWNKIAWGRDFTIETESDQGQKVRSDVFLDELQPRDRPDGRIKRVTVKLRFQTYDWYQKTGQDMWKGSCDGDITSKEPIRFTTSTKHKNPEEEEEEDQVDTWNIHIEPAEPKTVPTTGSIPSHRFDGNLKGELDGAHVGELYGASEFFGAGAWEGGGIGVEAGSWQGGGGAPMEGVCVFESAFPVDLAVSGFQATAQVQIPEITIKDPERNGTAKWKMIDRETKDTGMNTANQIVLEWKETMEPQQPGLGGDPTVYRRQHTGQIGWAYLIKCPWAVYNGLNADQEFE